jgi:hypothetical protein
MAAPATHQGEVALDPDHETAGELIVATGLRTAAPAFHLVFTERLAEESAAGRANGPLRGPAPQAVGLAASVAAGPVPSRRDRRRLVDRAPHVIAHRWTGQQYQRGCSEKESAHPTTTIRGGDEASGLVVAKERNGSGVAAVAHQQRAARLARIDDAWRRRGQRSASRTVLQIDDVDTL